MPGARGPDHSSHALMVPSCFVLLRCKIRTYICLYLLPGAYGAAGTAVGCPGAADGLQSYRHGIERDHPHRITAFNRGLRHAVDHTRFFTLRDGHAACSLDRSQAFGAIIAHAGHQHTDGVGFEFFGNAVQQHIDARAVTVDPGVIAEYCDISEGQPFHFQVPAAARLPTALLSPATRFARRGAWRTSR